MPVLNTKADILKLVLPSTKDLPEADQAWVELDVSYIKTNEIVGAGASTAQELAYDIVASRIKSWNYTDEAGAPLAVSTDNVGAMDAGDYKFIESEIGKDRNATPITDDQKKTSSAI